MYNFFLSREYHYRHSFALITYHRITPEARRTIFAMPLGCNRNLTLKTSIFSIKYIRRCLLLRFQNFSSNQLLGYIKRINQRIGILPDIEAEVIHDAPNGTSFYAFHIALF